MRSQGREMESAWQKRKGGPASEGRRTGTMTMIVDLTSIHTTVKSNFMEIEYFEVLINHPESISRIVFGNIMDQKFHSHHHAI
jgi:hypothetical protein